ncbi:ATP-binding protein [candidate division KSB1 bacterium]
MAVREIIRIDEELCDGCGLCVPACAEGAIQIVDGIAKLISETYCDGLGACLGDCPQGAITMEKRDADNFNEEAVIEHLKSSGGDVEAHLTHMAEHAAGDHDHHDHHDHHVQTAPAAGPQFAGCPSARVMNLASEPKENAEEQITVDDVGPSRLGNWPVQISLVPPGVPWLEGAELVLAADCAPFAYRSFHRDFLGENKAVIIGCPKLDDVEFYEERLSDIVASSNITGIKVIHMEVPCCFGLNGLAQKAVADSGKDIPITTEVIGVRGDRKNRQEAGAFAMFQ